MDKKPTLKKYILNELAKEGYISRDKVWAISKQFGHTDATVERTLRPSSSPTIEAIKNKRGCITGYKLKEKYASMISGEEDKRTIASTVSREATQEVCRNSQNESEGIGRLQVRTLW